MDLLDFLAWYVKALTMLVAVLALVALVIWLTSLQPALLIFDAVALVALVAWSFWRVR